MGGCLSPPNKLPELVPVGVAGGKHRQLRYAGRGHALGPIFKAAARSDDDAGRLVSSSGRQRGRQADAASAHHAFLSLFRIWGDKAQPPVFEPIYIFHVHVCVQPPYYLCAPSIKSPTRTRTAPHASQTARRQQRHRPTRASSCWRCSSHGPSPSSLPARCLCATAWLSAARSTGLEGPARG